MCVREYVYMHILCVLLCEFNVLHHGSKHVPSHEWSQSTIGYVGSSEE